MARRVDPALKHQRDAFLTRVLFAHSDASALTDATTDLLTQTIATTGVGHEIGDRMIWNANYGRQALERACSLLTQAAEAARSVDITVEIPEETPIG
ncbi:MAG: hypothetical protein R2722_11050 [Tessaracoccus sp.]